MRVPSFLRPFLGAALGALVALILYEAYGAAAPYLLAFLPQAPAATQEEGVYTDEQRQDRQDRIVLQARQALNREGR